jgi:hypothetical protein
MMASWKFLMRFARVDGCVLGLAAAAALAAGCGEKEETAAGGIPDPEHASDIARNPYALTCGDLRRQSHPEGTRLVIRVQAALTRERALRRRVAEQGFQRVNRGPYGPPRVRIPPPPLTGRDPSRANPGTSLGASEVVGGG